MADDDFESRILCFEEAWQRHGPADIAEHLKYAPASTRFPLLVELICIDLEYRWRHDRSSESVTLERYVAAFPELGPLARLPLELIGEEYRARHRWGDRPTHAAFLSRFGANPDLIRGELQRIDRELVEEAADPTDVVPSAKRPSAPELPVDQNPDVTLFSQRDVHLQRMIGSGSTGKVYQARQADTRHEIAVKFLRKSLLQERRVVQRFIGEAKTVARLRHPNIVGIQGLGRTTGGAYFIVMDLVTGSNLALVSRARPVTVTEAISWAIETCDALEHAHSKGIIHCDLKPANLLLGDDGRIRVTDFGLARSLHEDTPWTAEVEGTAPFMAPEQVSPCWGGIDERTDVYGVGAVLYALLTGHPPWFGQRLPDILAKVISGAQPVPAIDRRTGLPRAVSDICQRCLCKMPAERYRTTHDLRLALLEAASNE